MDKWTSLQSSQTSKIRVDHGNEKPPNTCTVARMLSVRTLNKIMLLLAISKSTFNVVILKDKTKPEHRCSENNYLEDNQQGEVNAWGFAQHFIHCSEV
ncbi:hypothetical protein M8J76_009774 [Diaphorina citri]|nr:hypothetical protein M8J75_016645 [Diaphorina citri]KAI5733264.1 hypothetical protein M8J76_009774 [Diaphorina citri]